MNKEREPGWYWVKIKSGNWVISEYDGNSWAWEGVTFPDESWEKIDEQKLTR